MGQNESHPWREIQKFPEALEAAAPEFQDAVSRILTLQGLGLAPVISAGRLQNRAAELVVSLAISDFDDLLREVSAGSGRAAMRSARTLIEHCINLASVLDSAEAATRYMRHLERGKLLLADSDFMTAALSEKKRRSVEHRQKRARREAKESWANAISDYGSNFARSWHPTNLLDRAIEHGLEDLYDTYRLASSVAHGSSAGAFGHFHLTMDNLGSFALGRSPELVPLALLVGAEAHFRLLTQVEDAVADIDLGTAMQEIQDLLHDCYEPIWECARSIATTMVENFEKGRQSATTYLAFSPAGKCRWYVEFQHLPGVWLKGIEDDQAREHLEALQTLMRVYIEKVDDFGLGGLAVIALPGIAIPVDVGARPIPSAAMLPRLIPSADMRSWSIVSAFEPDGTPISDGVLEGYSEMPVASPEEVGGTTDQRASDSMFWLDL